MEGRESFEHLELFQMIGVLGRAGAVGEISPGDRTAVGDGLRQG